MSHTLYIIGNGFDIYHELPSRYSDFKSYVQLNDPDLFENLEHYFNEDELWSDFEESLANINVECLSDEASEYLHSYGDDNWRESFHFEYQEYIEEKIEIVTIRLKKWFTEWMLTLNNNPTIKLNIDRTAKFITFNYTSSLENTYLINRNQILYIHNKAEDLTSRLILGHSRLPTNDNTQDQEYYENNDSRIIQGDEILNRYFNDTYKDTDSIIQENISFFENLKNIKKIYVLGHSISYVDIKYFQNIKTHISSDAKWVVSSYTTDEEILKKQSLLDMGISDGSIEMITLDQLKGNPFQCRLL